MLNGSVVPDWPAAELLTGLPSQGHWQLRVNLLAPARPAAHPLAPLHVAPLPRLPQTRTVLLLQANAMQSAPT